MKIVNAFLKRFGTSEIKKAIWNEEFRGGEWNHLESGEGSKRKTAYGILYYLGKYSNNGDILDLGCGSGRIGVNLELNRYSRYVGVDVSDVAISRAQACCGTDKQRRKKNVYVVSDISLYDTEQKFDVVLFQESIYYIRKPCLRKVLDKYISFLKEKGVVIVRIWDKYKHRSIVRLIENNYNVLENVEGPNGKMVTLVFR